jgi:hypothetical protein
MRVIEHGPSIGDHKGREIPEYIVESRGLRYDFNRVAVLDADGGFDLGHLARDEAIIAPGLVYRLQPKPTKE